MKKLFLQATPRARIAAVIAALYPAIISIVGFRLYRNPANSAAYEVIGYLSVVSVLIAHQILKRPDKIRWFLAGWVVLNVVYTIKVTQPPWSGNWVIFWIVPFGWLIQSTVVTLLFIPEKIRNEN